MLRVSLLLRPLSALSCRCLRAFRSFACLVMMPAPATSFASNAKNLRLTVATRMPSTGAGTRGMLFRPTGRRSPFTMMRLRAPGLTPTSSLPVMPPFRAVPRSSPLMGMCLSTVIYSLTRTFKGATCRFAYLRGRQLFQADGPDSKRACYGCHKFMQVHVCLLNPLSVNVVVDRWGLHCLQLEVQAGEQLVRWSAKAAWVPDLSDFAAAPRRRCKTNAKSSPSIVSCLSEPVVEPLGSSNWARRGMPRRSSYVW